MLVPHTLASVLIFAFAWNLSAQTQDEDRKWLLDATEAHCLSCHSGQMPKGGLELRDAFAEGGKSFKRSVIRRMRDRIAVGEMPPPGAKGFDASQRDAFVLHLESYWTAMPVEDVEPAKVTMRRLTRVEWDHCIRDLLGVDGRAQDFPADDLGYGFDTIGDVLSVSPLHLEKWLDAAMEIAKDAIILEDPSNPTVRRFEAEDMAFSLSDEPASGDFRGIYSNGDVTKEISLRWKGRYKVRVRAFGQKAGGAAARMALEVDRQERGGFEVHAPRSAPEVFEIEVELLPGKHVFGAAFTNDYYNPKAENEKERDRNLYVDWMEVIGPISAIEKPLGQKWLESLAGSGSEKAKTSRVLRALIDRAWRRPATDAEVHRIMKQATANATSVDSWKMAVQRAIPAILLSPHFVFRPEVDRGAKGAVRPLQDHELASRLSFFLWSSLPDGPLAKAASEGRLADQGVLREHATRLLRDPRASALASNFAAQWLELRNLEEVVPDHALFPDVDTTLLASMRRETEILFETILRERLPAIDLLRADFSFVDQRLARHYGLAVPEGSGFQRVTQKDASRYGLLGHASILTLTSNPTRTSPVKRGKWILDHLLDASPPPPPPGIGALDERPESLAAIPIRERLERHRTDPSCASCHLRMDGLGFALEVFDPVGRRRTKDGPHAVDSTGTLPDGTVVHGPEDLRIQLIKGDAFQRALLKNLFIYALGRGFSADDEPAIDACLRDLSTAPTLEELVIRVIESPAFRSTRRPK